MLNNEELSLNNKIIKKYIHSYQKRHYFKNDTPMSISFLITNRCNLRCKHCFNNKTVKTMDKSEKELTLDEYKIIAESMGFVASGLFCGGEPFIRNDVAEIVNIFRDKCNMQFTSTTTNGILTDSIIDQTERIVSNDKRKRFVLNFSLEGFESEHDITRGDGVYKKCIASIKEANKLKKKYSNLQIGIVTTMTTINENIVSDFFDYISEELEPNVISLLKVRQSPRAGEQLKNININNYIKAKEKLNKLFIKGKNGNVNSTVAYYPLTFYDIVEKSLVTDKREFYCYAGTHGAYIDYNGYVNPCEIIGDSMCSNEPLSMGNLRDYNLDFLKLWNSERARMVRSRINRHICCEKCTHETEGILPSIYFEPNAFMWEERMRKIVQQC
ncbi:radical SAM protein [Clostridium bornimense]|uniref:radical SAM protein n=1 Tax=Clostridium bornimense TaxID=1216932 RepID=UPI001C112AA2|nr:radical SAM protein [Clostridium bornimense]MBU5317323.1 radical SAM protein [Clostridium bornimense]